MAERVVLHVGCLKSGTSFVQRTLGPEPRRPRCPGLPVPRDHWRQQVLAVIDVRGHRRDGEVPADAVGAWDRLRAEIAAWPGTAIVSMEFLATTTPAGIQRIVASLAPAAVEVVLTVRDLGRSIPSMWQESVKNGESGSWAEFVAAVRDGDPRQPGPARRFWRHQAATPIARRWAHGVGVDPLTMVTVPVAGRARRPALGAVLHRRRAGPRALRCCVPPAGRGANESLGAASAEVMRTLNERLVGALSTHDYNAVVKRLAKRGLAPRRDREAPIGFGGVPDGPADAWLGARAQAMIDGLGGLGVRVVGDLEELRPLPVTGVDPADVPPDERLAATVDALAHLLLMWPKP